MGIASEPAWNKAMGDFSKLSQQSYPQKMWKVFSRHPLLNTVCGHLSFADGQDRVVSSWLVLWSSAWPGGVRLEFN